MSLKWLGIIGSVKRFFEFKTASSWWCVPSMAKKDDRILMYCPRSVNENRQGIFCLCKIKENPTQDNKENFACSCYGRAGPRLGSIRSNLLYVKLETITVFEKHITAKEMKKDLILSKAGFVRRNFQGTTFKIDDMEFKSLLDVLKEKNEGI